MKTIIIRIILILLILINCYIIFGFSSQNSDKSTSISLKVSRFIIDIVYKKESQNIKEYKAKSIEHVIRKLAHFSIYTCLGILVILLLNTYNISKTKKIVSSIIFGILYATSDEIHQSFIPGRSAEFTDVLIDTTGIIFGICIIFIICNWFDKRRESKVS